VIYGEHLNADEAVVTCSCGQNALFEVIDKQGQSHGWYCRRHAQCKRDELRRLEKLAKAIVRNGSRP
jgi:hypothetical protein